MRSKLSKSKRRLLALTGDALTGESLGNEILRATAIMRRDAADWAQIFHVKDTAVG